MRNFFREVFVEERRPSLIEILAMLKLYDSFLEQAEEKMPLSNQLLFDPEEKQNEDKKEDDGQNNHNDNNDPEDPKQKRSWFSRVLDYFTE